MKKTMFKKITASITAIMALTAMALPTGASAVNSPTIDALPAHKLETSTANAEIVVNKDIVLYNSEGKFIYEPNIVYNYEVSPANVTNATITTIDRDGNPVVLTVRSGTLESITSIVDGGDDTAPTTAGTAAVKNGTITFGKDNTTTKSTNLEATPPVNVSTDYKYTKGMTININANKIYDPDNDGNQDNGPGVYRYLIEDVTTEATYTASGVTDGKAANKIYLDVYTKYNTESNGLLIYGYVLLKQTEDGADTSIVYDSTTTDETVKIDGFVTSSECINVSENTVMPANMKSDSYHTYNLVVKKQVAGDLADKQHKFPFEITLSNSSITNSADFAVNNNGGTHTHQSFTTNSWASASASIPGIDFKLKHGDIINIIGLPTDTKVVVKETNDLSDIYAVSADGNGTALSLKNSDGSVTGSSIQVEKNGTAELVNGFAINTLSQADKLTVTNTLRDVSVTGLIFSIAPFIFLTVAGIILFAVFMHNKRKNKSDNMI
ncbi:MAG: hypothetical protein K6G33_08420 [Ruminococcus sp.]|uniref:DUF7601 domain-containing protein n=1 Tax=Ruminococcus sp. TaxID=41978 RepID=UPI0025F0DBCE|nr:hypothetical protein [Ruminococcus sp.]MCR5600749.1 hypothetical protein [Ruminococcus sp.]